MKRHLFIALGLAVSVLLAGCATKGGWPCWAWDRNTDQKNEAYGELQARYNAVELQYWAETNLVKKAELNRQAQVLHDKLTP